MTWVGPVLFGVTVVGNTALWSASLNWWYGHALPRPLLQAIRQVHGFLVVALPAGLLLLTGLHPDAAFRLAATGAPWRLVAGYVGLCWFTGLVLLPLQTLRRNLRRRPSALASEGARIVDIAGALGYPPVGRGKYRHLARLPGNQLFSVEFSERTLCLPRLPDALDGLTILHVTDLHLCGTPDLPFYKQVMDRCAEWEPELVAVTGDVVDSGRHHRWIMPVLSRLRWQRAGFAIVGNHDAWHDANLVRRRLRRVGFQVLGNSWQTVQVRGQPIVVIGNEWPWFTPAPDLRGAPDNLFRLCLSHTPDNMPWARAHQIDLMLAGHNHGGQIRFPVIGSVLVPSRFSRRYDCGTFEEPPTVLHVSRGLAGQHPLRYHCRPEVTLLTLRPAPVRRARPERSGLAFVATGR